MTECSPERETDMPCWGLRPVPGLGSGGEERYSSGSALLYGNMLVLNSVFFAASGFSCYFTVFGFYNQNE